jgi:opacity protein-like surface antigen
MKALAIFVGLGVSLLGSVAPAFADDGLPPAPPSMDPEDAINPLSIVTGAGVKVGEGTIFQPQIGIETGVVSNVFYQQSSPVTAGLLRILAEVGTGSLPSQRLDIHATGSDQDPNTPQTLTTANPGDFQYAANLYASWDQYLSTDNNVNAQGGLGGGLLLRGLVNPQRPLQFAFQEFFNRTIRATNFESRSDTNRDVNDLSLRLNYVPNGRALGGYLYYENTIDVFEASSQQFANRLHNTLGLRVNWQWLPLTRVFADVSEGYFTGIGDSKKINSFPFTAMGGIQTALTVNTTINAHAGFTDGFYTSGPNYSGLTAGALFGYRYSPLGRVTALYNYVHEDSINANFYRDHQFQVSVEQYYVPFILYAQPELRLRQYVGTIVPGTTGNNRDDVIGSVTVGMRYIFRDWLAGTLDYELSSVQTDFRYAAVVGGMAVDPSYVRHELLVGVRAAY